MLDEKDKDHSDMQKDDPVIRGDFFLTFAPGSAILLMIIETPITKYGFVVIKTNPAVRRG